MIEAVLAGLTEATARSSVADGDRFCAEGCNGGCSGYVVAGGVACIAALCFEPGDACDTFRSAVVASVFCVSFDGVNGG